MELRHFLLSLLIACLAGTAAIFEKVSLKGASPLTVFTIRSFSMTVWLMAAMALSTGLKPLFQVSGKTLLFILIPAVFATIFVGIYFSILKNDLASRVVPIIAGAPLVTYFLSVFILDEPLSWKRLIGVGLIVAGVSLVK